MFGMSVADTIRVVLMAADLLCQNCKYEEVKYGRKNS